MPLWKSSSSTAPDRITIKYNILHTRPYNEVHKGIPMKIVRPYIWALPVWGGLNACPDGLGHLFTAKTVILQIFSNWSQSAQPSPAPECPVEGGGSNPIWAMPKCRARQPKRVFPYTQSLDHQLFWFCRTSQH